MKIDDWLSTLVASGGGDVETIVDKAVNKSNMDLDLKRVQLTTTMFPNVSDVMASSK